jgi:hypothetical protein
MLAVVALMLATACEEAGQRGARRALQTQLRTLPAAGGYKVSDVHCTRAARYAYVQTVRTKRYFCTARLESGGCDLFRVDARTDGSAAFALVRRDSGCVLPA